MKLAVTGTTGDIGGGYLGSLGEDTTARVLIRKGSRVPHEDVQLFSFSDGFKYNPSFLEDFVESDTLLHCAAVLDSDQYDLADTLAVNAMLTGALAITVTRSDIPTKIIYISTEMVYALANGDELSNLCNKFLEFCKEQFTKDRSTYDLRALAQRFIKQNPLFAFRKYNSYALAKYLGEAIVSNAPDSTVLRVSNAYGPGYDNPRLVSRMVQGRLTGHDVVYPKEKRNFVYSDDINKLIGAVMERSLKGTIDCSSSETTCTQNLAERIIRATPTAYGRLVPAPPNHRKSQLQYAVAPATCTLADIIKPTSFEDGLTATIRWHRERTYHQMTDGRTLQDFLSPDEHVVQMLKGSSAAHLCVVSDPSGTKKVRKIAIYDGVEGNGIAKVANEIKYYQHISKHKQELAAIYPRLLDARAGETFSSETIEYLDGKNFYQSMKDGDLTTSEYKDSAIRFIGRLSNNVLQSCVPAIDPYGSFDAYYVERSLSRLYPISEVMTVQDSLVINGAKYKAPRFILADLLENEWLRNILKPRIEAFCFHGDLTFLNTVFMDDTHEIRLIDPRGYIGNWDPLYDYAKLQFTLGGFGELIIGETPIVTKETGGDFTIHFEQIPQASRQLHDSFLDILADDKAFKANIISHEPYWRERITFASATHFLADIPFRLYTDSSTATALASYVIGTYYLNKVYEDLKNETASR